MDKSNRYFIGYIVGFIASIALGVTVGLLVTEAGLAAVRVFIIIALAVTAAAVLTAFVMSMMNVYNYNRALAKQLSNHILLLVTGAVLTVAFVGVLALLFSMQMATGTVLKAMTGISVFAFGLVLTAALSFIYWLIKRSRVYTEE